MHEVSTLTNAGYSRIGDVLLTSGDPLRNGDNATMSCTNLDVHESIREKSNFPADWAVVKFDGAPKNPFEIDIPKDPCRCHHIRSIGHVPRRGKALVRGAGLRKIARGITYGDVYVPGQWRWDAYRYQSWGFQVRGPGKNARHIKGSKADPTSLP